MEEHFHSKTEVCSKAHTEHGSTQSRKKKSRDESMGVWGCGERVRKQKEMGRFCRIGIKTRNINA